MEVGVYEVIYSTPAPPIQGKLCGPYVAIIYQFGVICFRLILSLMMTYLTTVQDQKTFTKR